MPGTDLPASCYSRKAGKGYGPGGLQIVVVETCRSSEEIIIIQLINIDYVAGTGCIAGGIKAEGLGLQQGEAFAVMPEPDVALQILENGV